MQLDAKVIQRLLVIRFGANQPFDPGRNGAKQTGTQPQDIVVEKTKLPDDRNHCGKEPGHVALATTDGNRDAENPEIPPH